MKRRSAVSVLLSIAGALVVRCTKGRIPHERPGTEPLGREEIAALAAAAECVYPSNDTMPGARSLGFESYLTAQAQTKYYRRSIPSLRHAVETLDSIARNAYGRNFVACTAEQRRGAFDAFARRNGAAGGTDATAALNALVDITLEGCFSHPRHGGNKDMKAWAVMKNALQNSWYLECECTG